MKTVRRNGKKRGAKRSRTILKMLIYGQRSDGCSQAIASCWDHINEAERNALALSHCGYRNARTRGCGVGRFSISCSKNDCSPLGKGLGSWSDC
jgi:hypothetical protein